VVTAVKPELLITDEILAVGDESFQAKCICWIENYLEEGGTLLMVSHSMYQVQKLCQHAIWIDEGSVRMSGDVFRVTQTYLAWHEQKAASDRRKARENNSNGRYRVKHFQFGTDSDSCAEDIATFPMGSQIIAELHLSQPDVRAPVAVFGLVRADGTPVYGVSSDYDQVAATMLSNESCRYRICFDNIALLPGSYSLRAHAMDPQGLRICDTREIPFIITGSSLEVGFVQLPHQWLD